MGLGLLGSLCNYCYCCWSSPWIFLLNASALSAMLPFSIKCSAWIFLLSLFWLVVMTMCWSYRTVFFWELCVSFMIFLSFSCCFLCLLILREVRFESEIFIKLPFSSRSSPNSFYCIFCGIASTSVLCSSSAVRFSGIFILPSRIKRCNSLLRNSFFFAYSFSFWMSGGSTSFKFGGNARRYRIFWGSTFKGKTAFFVPSGCCWIIEIGCCFWSERADI